MKASPPITGRAPIWTRIVWLTVVVSLLATMMAIYVYLLPSPNHLAVAEEFTLNAGEEFVLEPLPMGGRYVLRSCDHATELRATIGNWSSGWIRLPVNPIDASERDLRIDGRSGGTLRIQARTPTGRLILFRSRSTITCRGNDPQDLEFSALRVAGYLPPFECDNPTLTRYDREALETLEAEILARHGAPLSSPILSKFAASPWYHKQPSFDKSQLSQTELDCLRLLNFVAGQAPEPGALPQADQNFEADTPSEVNSTEHYP